MAKGIYVGVDNIARKVKKLYFGVDGVARKVTKGYIGVGGVARPFFSAEKKPMKYGAIDTLSTRRYCMASATVGDYALFEGGWDLDSSQNDVDCYDSNLVKRSVSQPYYDRGYPCGATVGNYAVFMGEKSHGETYDVNLVYKNVSGLKDERQHPVATTVGNNAIFAGGYHSIYSSKVAYAVNENLVMTEIDYMTAGRVWGSATTVGDYAIFAGGYKGVDTYDKNLVKGTATAFTEALHHMASTTVGDYAIFAGGSTNYSSYGLTTDSSVVKTVYTYDKNLVKGTASDLDFPKNLMGSTTLGDYAIFAGGCMNALMGNVETYDKNLVKGTLDDLSKSKYGLSATTVGDYAIFAGGTSSNIAYMDVDAYQLA